LFKDLFSEEDTIISTQSTQSKHTTPIQKKQEQVSFFPSKRN